MSAFSYEKISRISLSSSSSGMMMGSGHSCSELLEWKDGSVTLTKTEIRGFEEEVSVWNISEEQAEKVRAFAEREEMAEWGSWKYEEDPRFRCTDVSSSSSGSIILDLRDKGGKPYEIISFNPRAVFANGKGDAMTALRVLFEEMEDPDTRASYTKGKTGATPYSMNGFMGMGMAAMMAGNGGTDSDAGGWTCKCGTFNVGRFCSECGSERPQ